MNIYRVLLGMTLAAGPALGIDCAQPDGPAEQTVCTHPDLKAKDDAITRQTAALKTTLKGGNAAILADTEMPFLRLRNDCSNESDIPACLSKVLGARQDLLNRAAAQPDAIREALAQVRYVDVSFLWKYWPQLVGRKLSVFGCLILDDAAPRTTAVLEADNQKSVAVRFKSMPEEMADFLDDQKPCAHWLVEVRKEGDGPLLYAEEVLGRPLP